MAADPSTEDFDSEEVPFLLKPVFFTVWLAFVILYIVFTILTLGIFLPNDEAKKQEEKKQNGSVEEKLRVSLARKTNRLQKVSVRIGELQLVRGRILRTERRVFFCVRCIIALLLIVLNWAFLQNNPRDRVTDLLDDIANLNTCILLAYTLPGYLLYGTVGRLTAALKTKTTQILRRRHIPTFSELQLLKDEETHLKRDISYLKMRLEEFD